jgi:hypothetical protein
LYLLVSLILLLLSHPFLKGHIVGVSILNVFFSATLLVAVYVLSRRKMLMYIGLGLSLPMLVARWWVHFSQNPPLLLIGFVFGGLFFAFVAIALLARILREDKVSMNTIYGAICVYLLIGISWGFLYALTEFLHPGSFVVASISAPEPVALQTPFNDTLTYFSFATLTTLGYGDITPTAAPARTLAYLEAIVGQFYMAILVARLIGLHIVRDGNL